MFLYQYGYEIPDVAVDEVIAFFVALGALIAGFIFLVYLDIKWFPYLIRNHVRFFRPRR